MKGGVGIRGMITASVMDSEGNIKREKPGFLRRIFGIPGREMISKHHNVITREGEALIAYNLSETYRTKVIPSMGHIQLGTGWTGVNTKENRRCNTSTGEEWRYLEYDSAILKAPFGETGDNVLIYTARYPPGFITVQGINEACLLTNNSGMLPNCFAYGQITPALNLTNTDILQIVWEVTIGGK